MKIKKKYAITCSIDGSICKWDLGDERRLQKSRGGHNDSVCGINIIDGYIVSYGYDKKILIWDYDLKNYIQVEGYSNDWLLCGETVENKNILLTGDASGTIDVWNLSSLMHSSKHNGYLNTITDIKTFSSHINGHSVCAIASTDSTIRLWDIVQDRITTILDGHKGWINSVLPCCNGKSIISCGSDKKIILYNILDGNCIDKIELYGHDDNVLCVDSMDKDKEYLSSFVTGSNDGSFIVWDIHDGYQIGGIKYGGGDEEKNNLDYINVNKQIFPVEHKMGISVIKQVSRNIVITGGYDNNVIMWNLVTPNDSKIIIQHSDWVSDIIINQINDYAFDIISVGVDGLIFIKRINQDDTFSVYSLKERKNIRASRLLPLDSLKYRPLSEFNIYERPVSVIMKHNWKYIKKMLSVNKKGNEFIALTSKGLLYYFTERYNNETNGYEMRYYKIENISDVSNISNHPDNSNSIICVLENKSIVIFELFNHRFRHKNVKLCEILQGFSVVDVDFSKADFGDNYRLHELLRKNGAIV